MSRSGSLTSGVALIINGPAFIEGRVRPASVRIQDGAIAEISETELRGVGDVIDLKSGELLLPAAVDTLAAMRDWGEEDRDTVETVTKGALAAGVTFVCDQANTVPRINTPELIRERGAFIRERSYTDFAVATHAPKNPDRLVECRKAGALVVQMFPWDLRPWNEPLDTDDSHEVFARIAEAGLRALIFVDELALRSTPLHAQGERYALAALLRRLPPNLVAQLYVTLPESVDLIIAAKKNRLPNIRISIPAHNALMSYTQAHQRIGMGAMQVPPLRSDEEVTGMRERVEDGRIDMFMSHHAPHRMADKYSADPVPGEFTPKAGYSSIDITFPLLLSRLGVAVACRAFCEAPAEHLRLKKGRIAAGYDADLVIVEQDPGRVHENVHVTGRLAPGIWRVDPPPLFFSKGHVTPFWGERLTYLVMKTFLRGQEVFDRATGTFRRGDIRQVR